MLRGLADRACHEKAKRLGSNLGINHFKTHTSIIPTKSAFYAYLNEVINGAEGSSPFAIVHDISGQLLVEAVDSHEIEHGRGVDVDHARRRAAR